MSDFLNAKQGISVERLDDLARIFEVPVADLFNPNATAPPAAVIYDRPAASDSASDAALLAEHRRALAKLVHYFERQAPDAAARRARPDTAGKTRRRARSRARPA